MLPRELLLPLFVAAQITAACAVFAAEAAHGGHWFREIVAPGLAAAQIGLLAVWCLLGRTAWVWRVLAALVAGLAWWAWLPEPTPLRPAFPHGILFLQALLAAVALLLLPMWPTGDSARPTWSLATLFRWFLLCGLLFAGGRWLGQATASQASAAVEALILAVFAVASAALFHDRWTGQVPVSLVMMCMVLVAGDWDAVGIQRRFLTLFWLLASWAALWAARSASRERPAPLAESVPAGMPHAPGL